VCFLSFIACFLLVFVGYPLSLSLYPSLDVVLISNLNFYCFLLLLSNVADYSFVLGSFGLHSLFLVAL